MSNLLERLDKAVVHFSTIGTDRKRRSSPFCYHWDRSDTRQLLEDAAKEIRRMELIVATK